MSNVDALNDYIGKNLPGVAATGTRVVSIDQSQLLASAPLEKNGNGRGSAFGASLYTVAMTTCYAAIYRACQAHIDNPDIVIRDAQMRYRHRCTADPIQASCRLPSARQWEGFFAHYEKTGKTTISLTSKIVQDDEVCAYFEGVFVLLGSND